MSLVSFNVALWIVAALFALGTLATSQLSGALLAAIAVLALPTLQGKLGARMPDLVSRTGDTRHLIPSDQTLVLFNFAYLLVSAAVNLMAHWVELGGNAVVKGSVADAYFGQFVVLGIPVILTALIPLWFRRPEAAAELARPSTEGR